MFDLFNLFGRTFFVDMTNSWRFPQDSGIVSVDIIVCMANTGVAYFQTCHSFELVSNCRLHSHCMG